MTPSIALPAVTPREFDAILGGLRALQHLMYHNLLPGEIVGIVTDHGHGLSPTEIDDLCHRLNCS
jgi:hypothetical protein